MDLQTKIHNFLQQATQGARNFVQPAVNEAQQLPQQVQTFGQNLYAQALPQLAQAQQFIESPQQFTPFQSVVERSMPFLKSAPTDNLFQAIGKGAVKLPEQYLDTILGQGLLAPTTDVGRLLGADLTNQPLPQYSSLKSAPVRLAFNLMGTNETPQSLIGNTAGTFLPAVAAGAGSNFLKTGTAATPFARIAQGALQGGIGGAEYSGANALSESRNAPDIKTQVMNALTQMLIGGGAGALTGGAVSGGKEFMRALDNQAVQAGQSPEQGGGSIDRNKTLSELEFEKAKAAYLGGDLKAQTVMQSAHERMQGKMDIANFEDAYHTGNYKLAKQIAEASSDPGVKAMAQMLPSINNTEKGGIDFFAKVGGKDTPAPPENNGPGVDNPQDPYFNVNRYNVPSEAKAGLKQAVEETKPQIEEVVGKKLSNNEALQYAKASSTVLTKVVGRDQTLSYQASLLKVRQKLADAAQNGTVDQDYLDNLLAVKSQATDIARKLQSFSIGADPQTTSLKDQVLEAVLKVNQNTDEVLQAAKGVDFNDANQAANFYRQFIKPTTTNWIDLLRYNSMLSSPNTHIVNAFSNLLNTAGVAPLEHTVSGTIDYLGSTVTGTPRQYFAGEGGAYVKGYYANIGNAAHRFADVVRGKSATTNLDVRDIPIATIGVKGSLVKQLSLPTKLLEASDQFFTALTQAGEEAALTYRQARGGAVGNIEATAGKTAAYRLFRSELFPKEQGHVLNAVDELTQKIMQLRSSQNPIASTIAKYTLPFVRTPMNILKQGIEYSPAGFSTLPGATNKTEQLSKAIIGSSAAAATALLVTSGRTTWAEPTDPAKRAAFRAAGLQPYAVKIGNQWISYAKLNPAFGFPVALVSSLHDAQQNQTLHQNQIDAILTGVSQWGGFFSDQSYLKNIGDAIAATKGSPENLTQFVSNYPQQWVPYRALLGWLARLSDPYQRKVDTNASSLEKQVQTFLMQIPGLSQTVPARTDQFGSPILNQNRVLNALSPLRVTTENPDQKQLFDLMQRKSLQNKNVTALQAMLRGGETPTQAQLEQAFGGTQPTTGSTTPSPSSPLDMQKLKIEDAMARQRVSIQGGTVQTADAVFYQTPQGTVQQVPLNRPLPPIPSYGLSALDKEGTKAFVTSVNAKIGDIAKLAQLGYMPPPQAEKEIEKLQFLLQSLKPSRKPRGGKVNFLKSSKGLTVKGISKTRISKASKGVNIKNLSYKGKPFSLKAKPHKMSLPLA